MSKNGRGVKVGKAVGPRKPVTVYLVLIELEGGGVMFDKVGAKEKSVMRRKRFKNQDARNLYTSVEFPAYGDTIVLLSPFPDMLSTARVKAYKKVITEHYVEFTRLLNASGQFIIRPKKKESASEPIQNR